MPHIHLIILISARWSINSFSFITGHVSLPCNIHVDRRYTPLNIPDRRLANQTPPCHATYNYAYIFYIRVCYMAVKNDQWRKTTSLHSILTSIKLCKQFLCFRQSPPNRPQTATSKLSGYSLYHYHKQQWKDTWPCAIIAKHSLREQVKGETKEKSGNPRSPEKWPLIQQWWWL